MGSYPSQDNWYLSDGIFKVRRLDETFVEASARDDRVFEALSLVLLDILRSLSLHAETQSSTSSIECQINRTINNTFNIALREFYRRFFLLRFTTTLSNSL